jgi:hypothetical protein
MDLVNRSLARRAIAFVVLALFVPVAAPALARLRQSSGHQSSPRASRKYARQQKKAQKAQAKALARFKKQHRPIY